MTASLDEARLRELAEAAYHDYGVADIAIGGGMRATVSVPAFIQAASPATILALLDALSAERERADRAEWKPIEEHDGSQEHMLLTDGHNVWEGRLTDHGWYERNNDWTDAWGGEDYPTHFRPLPAPPLATQKAEGAPDAP